MRKEEIAAIRYLRGDRCWDTRVYEDQTHPFIGCAEYHYWMGYGYADQLDAQKIVGHISLVKHPGKHFCITQNLHPSGCIRNRHKPLIDLRNKYVNAFLKVIGYPARVYRRKDTMYFTYQLGPDPKIVELEPYSKIVLLRPEPVILQLTSE